MGELRQRRWYKFFGKTERVLLFDGLGDPSRQVWGLATLTDREAQSGVTMEDKKKELLAHYLAHPEGRRST